MKTTLKLFFAAASIILLAASCKKEQTQPTEREVTIDIKVENLLNDTKAVKAAWENGDKINIWFDLGPDKFSPVYYDPELILTFNGTKWTPSFDAKFNKSKLYPNGKIIAVYEGSNDISTFSERYRNPGSGYIYYRYAPGKVKSNYYMTPMMVVCNKSYTYDSEANKITANLASWDFLTKIQVVISGLDQTKDKYTLSVVDYNNEGYAGLFAVRGFQLAIGSFNHASEYDFSSKDYGVGGGAANADGIAFYFYESTKEGVAANYRFRLETLQSDDTWTAKYYTANNQTITTSDTKILPIKIPVSKFTD